MDQSSNSIDKSFNFADYIDYDPEPDGAKLANAQRPQQTISIDERRRIKLNEVILEHIKSSRGQVTESFVTKERFVCSLCFAIYLEKDLLRQHFINSHGYEDPNPPKVVNEKSKAKVIDDEKSVATADAPIEEEIIEIVVKEVDEEKEWLNQPISLKILKQKLYKSFTVKCSVNGCVYQFEDNEKQQRHEKCHVLNDAEQIRQFKCLECNVKLKMWRDLTAHMWKDHKIDIDLLKCPCCSFKATLSVKIFRHMQIHKELKGFVCSLCPEKFMQFAQLRSHVGTDHVDNSQSDSTSRWYSKKTCEICSNIFANSKTLTKHVKTVHNRIKPFICSVCGYKSARKSTWEIHIRQHTGEKPMACKVCSFCTADPSVLRKHEMRHNDKTKYKCTECDYNCIQSSNFKNHIKRYHPDYYSQLLCDQCPFVSINLDALRKHVQDHRLGLIRNEDSNDTGPGNSMKRPNATNAEISADCFMPVESTDSMPHDQWMDTGGLTIPAHHSDEAQFPN